MIKEKDILIRVNSKLKEKVKIKAEEKGLSISGYVRMLILEKLNLS